MAFVCCGTSIFFCGPAFAVAFNVQKIFGRFFGAGFFILNLFIRFIFIKI
jgi:hypothetical protein